MSDMQTFPETVDEFMEHYKIIDTEQVYTNGVELVPIFRMQQWFEHSERKTEWIPVKTRPMDEEERKEWSEKVGYELEGDDAVIYTSQLPDDGQECIVCTKWGNVFIDTFQNDPDYGCAFEDHGDMDGITAWMPLPRPWKGRTDETD